MTSSHYDHYMLGSKLADKVRHNEKLKKLYSLELCDLIEQISLNPNIPQFVRIEV